jgi:superfamily II DNA/RNA helicase
MPRIAVIHGDKTQKDREFAISNFKSGFSPILVQKLPSFYFVVL